MTYAFRSGNADAIIALLEAGASPHPYQGLWLTSNTAPIFMFPYLYLMANEALDAEEKQKVAKAMQRAGAAITRYQPGVTSTDGTQREQVEKIFSRSKDVFGFQLEETP